MSHVVATLLNKAYVLSDGAYTEVDNGYACGNHTIERAVIRSTETPRTLRYGKHEKIIFRTYDENGLVRLERVSLNDYIQRLRHILMSSEMI